MKITEVKPLPKTVDQNFNLIKTTVITDVICDCCGKSCRVDLGIVDNEEREDHGQPDFSFEFMELNSHWGYFSDKDGERWSAQLCESCVDEKLSFVSFLKQDYM